MPIDIDQLDLTDGRAVASALAEMKPELVINCAAYTRVDQAESEPKLCRAVNALAVGYLADACEGLDCPLVQISTDYVFGDTGTVPFAPAAPRGRPDLAARRLRADQAGRRTRRGEICQAPHRAELRPVRPAIA